MSNPLFQSRFADGRKIKPSHFFIHTRVRSVYYMHAYWGSDVLRIYPIVVVDFLQDTARSFVDGRRTAQLAITDFPVDVHTHWLTA